MKVCREYIRLRYRLMPYIYGAAARCVAESLPMARALVVEYQDDPNTWNLGDEFLFGDSLLVAPICAEEDQRRVYLPAGVWTDWWTRERIPGGQWLDVKAGIRKLPLYVREGGIIPMGPVMDYVDAKKTGKISLLIAPFARDGRSSFTVPANDEQVRVDYVAAGGRHSITIAPSRVAFEVESLGKAKLRVARG